MEIKKFKKEIWSYYRKADRNFPWRRTHDPYRILVSEIMLQQTQTYRVEPKYQEFIKNFPDFKTLALASVSSVLKIWQGLGYNRRALYLKKIAEEVVATYKGKLPDDPLILRTLPGIGPNTAGSIAVFAFNRPTVFIETNIRRVFIHFFFPKHDKIHDAMLMPLIETALDRKNPREWYYALMDYGAMLKKKIENPNRRSRHYTLQPKFAGSVRQTRGHIIRLLLEQPRTNRELEQASERDVASLKKILDTLEHEGFIVKTGRHWRVVS